MIHNSRFSLNNDSLTSLLPILWALDTDLLRRSAKCVAQYFHHYGRHWFTTLLVLSLYNAFGFVVELKHMSAQETLVCVHCTVVVVSILVRQLHLKVPHS